MSLAARGAPPGMEVVVRFRVLVGLLVMIVGPRTAAAQAPDSVVLARRAAFLAAYNAGDAARLTRFVETHVRLRAPEEAAQEVWYWGAVRREVGPIAFVRSVVERAGGREREWLWYRGTVTGAWLPVELPLEATAPWRIAGRGVRRGAMPDSAATPPPAGRALRDSLAAYVRAIGDSGYFSGAVIVARGTEVLYEGAVGWADHERRRRLTLDTPFGLASVSKMFTGVAIAQLAERGRLALDDPIARFVPEYPAHIASQVTIRHLLTHTSGLELDGDAGFVAAVRAARSMEEILAAQVAHLPRLNAGNYATFTPLNRFDYTNEGIDLLGVIIERAGGRPWSAWLRDEVFRAAGMTRAGADLLAPVPDLAAGFALSRSPTPGVAVPMRVPGEPAAMGPIRPAGTAWASARDMLRFIRALRAGRLVGAPWVDSVTRVQVSPSGPLPGMGYGLTFGNTALRNGDRAIGHRGGDGRTGISTVVEFYPAADVTIVVLSNYSSTEWWVNQHLRDLLGLR